MKILVTATTFPRWQNDTEPAFVYFLSELLAKKGFEIVVLAPMHRGAKKFEKRGNMRIHRFSYFFGLEMLCYEGGILSNMKRSFLAKLQVPFLVVGEYLAMRKIVKRDKPDVIHAHWVIPQGFVAAFFRKKCRIVSTAHAGDVFPLKSKLLRLFGKFALVNSDAITANSSYTRQAIKNIADVPVTVIPMGVDLKAFRPEKRTMAIRKRYGIKSEFLLSVGRLAEKKGIKYLVLAMPLVLKKFPRAKLLIVGDGPELASLLLLTKHLRLEGKVIFAGKIQNKLLPAYYATADIFICPSIVTGSGDTEGLGVVLLESIASGTPVIASNVGGIPDIVKHRETGLLVEQKNPEQLAQAIVKLLKDKPLQKKLVTNAQKHVEQNYDWDIIADKFAELLKNL